MSNDGLVPLDFWYAGVRVGADSKPIISIFVIEGNTLTERHYAQGRESRRWAIGHRYTGAKFSGTKVSGLNLAKFAGSLTKHPSAPEWEALDEQAEVEMKLRRREADAKKRGELDEMMLPVRRVYSRISSGLDRAAFESAVLRSLRRAP